jgi:hypothetical protein
VNNGLTAKSYLSLYLKTQKFAARDEYVYGDAPTRVAADAISLEFEGKKGQTRMTGLPL